MAVVARAELPRERDAATSPSRASASGARTATLPRPPPAAPRGSTVPPGPRTAIAAVGEPESERRARRARARAASSTRHRRDRPGPGAAGVEERRLDLAPLEREHGRPRPARRGRSAAPAATSRSTGARTVAAVTRAAFTASGSRDVNSIAPVKQRRHANASVERGLGRLQLRARTRSTRSRACAAPSGSDGSSTSSGASQRKSALVHAQRLGQVEHRRPGRRSRRSAASCTSAAPDRCRCAASASTGSAGSSKSCAVEPRDRNALRRRAGPRRRARVRARFAVDVRRARRPRRPPVDDRTWSSAPVRESRRTSSVASRPLGIRRGDARAAAP